MSSAVRRTPKSSQTCLEHPEVGLTLSKTTYGTQGGTGHPALATGDDYVGKAVKRKGGGNRSKRFCAYVCVVRMFRALSIGRERT
jgi:RNase P protein component